MMKTLKVLSLVLFLGGCVHAGPISFWEERADWVSDADTYPISYFDDNGPRLIKSEPVVDTGFALDKVLTAYKGYPVADAKKYDRNYYTQDAIVAPKDATLSSGLSPISIEAKKKYDVIGEVELKDGVFAVVASGESKTVFLVDNQGKVYKHLGVIRKDRLVLLDDHMYVVVPGDFRFESVDVTKVVQSDIVEGFEIRYEGIKLDRSLFTVMEYQGNENGAFVNVNYSRRPGIINIHGIKIKILNATDTKIDYMLVK